MIPVDSPLIQLKEDYSSIKYNMHLSKYNGPFMYSTKFLQNKNDLCFIIANFIEDNNTVYPFKTIEYIEDIDDFDIDNLNPDDYIIVDDPFFNDLDE